MRSASLGIIPFFAFDMKAVPSIPYMHIIPRTHWISDLCFFSLFDSFSFSLLIHTCRYPYV